MVVDISRIAKQYGEYLDVNIIKEIDNIEHNGQQIDFISPVNVIGTITNLGELFIFEGSVEISFKTSCNRCLNDYQTSLKIDVTEKFAQEENDDVNVFYGDSIDLKDMVINNIILNLPIGFFCSETCQGLCPKCGINKNHEQCDCPEDDCDPRLEKLKSLFKIN